MTRPAIARAWNSLPAILAFGILAFQAAIPWTTRRFVTQDGPSHLYTGIVLKDLLLHRQSPYRAVYMLQPEIVPNWAGAVLLATAATLVGAAHAEQLLASFCIVAGFFAFSYARAALDPERPYWSPVTNFLLQTSFLSIGFYNFYLGVALFPLAPGYYMRHLRQMTPGRAMLLAAGLIGLFFTHILAAALAALTLIVIALWMHIAVPLFSPPPRFENLRRSLNGVGLLVAALIPLLVLTAFFAKASKQGVNFRPETARALNDFPMNVFVTGPGRSGRQELLWPAVLFYMSIAALALRRDECRTPKAAVLIAAIAIFACYLLAPDDGFGGQEVKKRLAWAVFILGCLLACSAKRLHGLRVAVSIYIAYMLAGTLMTSIRVSHAIGRSVDTYVSAMDRIPDGATFVRLYYPIPGVPARFGFQGVPLAPLFHAEAYIAATRRMIDLSDYQAASGLFPVTYAPIIDTNHRYALWGFENSANNNAVNLNWLRATLPVPLDYVVVVGEETSSEARATGMTKTLADLDSGMRLIGAASADAFVRVYQRTGAR